MVEVVLVSMQAEQLERLVEKTAARIDRHVVNTLLDKFSFVSHCSAIKRYLLLSQVRHHDPLHTNVRMTVHMDRMCLFTPPGWQGCPRNPALMLTLLITV